MKILGVSLVAVSLFLLAACGASEGPGTTGGGESGETPAAKKAPETPVAPASTANLAPAAADGQTVVLDVTGMT